MTDAQRKVYDRHRENANVLLRQGGGLYHYPWCSCVMVGKPCPVALEGEDDD